MLMTSCFVCATLNLGRKKSTGTEPKHTYIFWPNMYSNSISRKYVNTKIITLFFSLVGKI